MKALHITFVIALVGISLTGCGRPKYPIIYTSAGSGATFKSVSDKECEIETGHETLLAQCSSEGGKLRVVFGGASGGRVVYYPVYKFGIREPDPPFRTFLTSEAYARVQKQMDSPAIGASKDDFARVFGPPVHSSKAPPSDYETCTFEANGFLTFIQGDFLNDKCEHVVMRPMKSLGRKKRAES